MTLSVVIGCFAFSMSEPTTLTSFALALRADTPLPNLKCEAEGGALHPAQVPGQAEESNWLPASSAPFWTVMRLYWPKPEIPNDTRKELPLAFRSIMAEAMQRFLDSDRRSNQRHSEEFRGVRR
jgi:hypothetical protein